MRRSAVLGRKKAATALKRLAQKGTLRYKQLGWPLRHAVLLYWRSMAGARLALGLEKPPANRQLWSRGRVMEEIVKLHRSGQHMSYGAVAKAGRDDLISAANVYVGSWSRARALAGVSFKPRRRASVPVWDASSVVAEIKQRHRGGSPLAPRKTPSSLTNAGIRIFGSWRNAVTAAGIHYDSVLLRRNREDDELLAWLRRLARTKPRMTLHELEKTGQHAVICRRRWGSLEAAAQAAGLIGWPLRVRHRAMSRPEVIRTLREWHAAKRSLKVSTVKVSPGGLYLINSARNHFATWSAALAAAGLSVEQRHRAGGAM